MDMQVLEEAVSALRPSLQADGFDLRAGEIGEDQSVRVILEAKPDACLDCLVPEHLMIRLIEDSIQRQGGDVSRVVLTRVGFDDIAAH